MRGKGVADQLLAWAKQQASIRAADFLRLDYRKDRQRLVRYYLEKGFNKMNSIEVDRVVYQLFEMQLPPNNQ